MKLSIVTPEGPKVTAEVTELTAPGALGEMGILPGHIPVLTVLDIGALSYVAEGGEKKTLAVNGGFLEVNDNDLIVLTETAEYAEEIDVERATKARDAATQSLSKLESGSEEYQAGLDKQRRAENRLTIAKGGTAH